ncbi:DNA replication/repair protein RecF [Elioraea sp.]|uniref:DNA replication/repair protein RecF n=1 Tax=Elioraea sp. TaxID=2185103 RepID=UPI003F7178B4
MAPLRLDRLTLTCFRSYQDLTARFTAPVVVLVGQNGAGKTNLLEAISLLTPGRGLRGARLAELARREPDGSVAPTWAVAGRVTGPEGPLELGTGVEEAGATRRAFLLDGAAPRSQAEIAARVAAVWLTPQMDRLFLDGAAGRRRFLDRLVWAIEPAHAREVAAYETALAERNRLLAGRADPAWLDGLEDAMARHGIAVAAARRELVARLNRALAARVVGAFPAARAEVVCDWVAALEAGPALAAEDALRLRLREGRTTDAASGSARIGPHRADLALIHAPKNLPAALCSTGEQKVLLVSVVLGHAALIAEARGFAPILLLDEVAAHLDAPRREALFAALAGLPAQAFLTGTDARVFAPLAGGSEAFRVEGGMLDPIGLGSAHPVPSRV